MFLQAFNLIPESALFNRLVMQEREIDYQIKRYRSAIQGAAAPYEHPVMKRLRIYIYATHMNQQAATQQQQQHPLPLLPRTSSSAGGAEHGDSSILQEPPQWTLNIWGRLVDINDPTPPAGSAAAAMLAAMQVTTRAGVLHLVFCSLRLVLRSSSLLRQSTQHTARRSAGEWQQHTCRGLVPAWPVLLTRLWCGLYRLPHSPRTWARSRRSRRSTSTMPSLASLSG